MNFSKSFILFTLYIQNTFKKIAQKIAQLASLVRESKSTQKELKLAPIKIPMKKHAVHFSSTTRNSTYFLIRTLENNLFWKSIIHYY